MGGIETDYARIYYEDPIIHMVFKEGIELGVPEIKELTAYAEMLSGRQPYVVFSDVCENVDITQEGRRFAGNAENSPLHRGSAVLVKNHLYQLAANVFIKFDKPAYPYRAFTDRKQAIEWLKTLPLK